MMKRWVLSAVVMGMLGCGLARGAEKSVLDPKEADKDFAYQGEYTGQIQTPDGMLKVGAQVVALGDGKFKLVGYQGGLPGDGWRKGDEKLETEGRLADGVLPFSAEDVAGKVKDGVMTVTNQSGEVLGTLKKVERKSPTLGKKPPEGAVVLYGGKESKDQWTPGRLVDDYLRAGNNSKKKIGSCTLHVEFYLPYEPKGRGQGRGNSGVYLQGRYEVQVLDSFGLEGKNNEAGGIYTVSDPAVNMCLPPLQWQTYDIDFTAAEFDAAGKKTKNARMTVRHNGVVVQDDVEIPNITTAAPNQEGPEPQYIHIQDHGHPVLYQNIWLVEKK